MRLTTALFLALCLPFLARASSPFPGGVLDSTGRTAYLSTAESIVAVDLSTGEVRWRSDESSEPLFVVTDRLYALAATRAGRLYIRALNLDNHGRRVFESEPIELPRWAVPENGPGRSFSFRWTRDRSRLDLHWQIAAWAEGAPRKQSAGTAGIDLMTGKVRQHETPVTTTEKVPVVLERLSVRWHNSESGQVRAVVSEEQSASSAYQRLRALVLKRWDERGRELSSCELLRGQEPIVLPDATGQRLWVRDSTAPPDRDSKTARWLVYSTDGREIARVPIVPGTTAATIHGNRAYFLTPSGVRIGPDQLARRGRALVSVDLQTGKVVWRRPL